MASIAPETIALPATRTPMRHASRRPKPHGRPLVRLLPIVLLGPLGTMIWMVTAAYFASPAIGFMLAALVITTLASPVAKMCSGTPNSRGGRS
jgi:hypothetical protein